MAIPLTYMAMTVNERHYVMDTRKDEVYCDCPSVERAVEIAGKLNTIDLILRNDVRIFQMKSGIMGHKMITAQAQHESYHIAWEGDLVEQAEALKHVVFDVVARKVEDQIQKNLGV